MFGKSPRVNPLESRKQLLVAASEINRAQLLQEWEALAGGASSLAERARSITAIASGAAALVAGVGAFRCDRAVPAAANPSRLETVLRGARLACSIWLVLRGRSRS